MKRTIDAVLIIFILCIMVCGVGFYIYRIELIWLIVRNDMLQKAPDDYPRERILEAFDQHRRSWEKGSRRTDTALVDLSALSQTLEKTQYLSALELDKMLRTFLTDTATKDNEQKALIE
ncbi:MAG: hypothetical protein HYR55_00300 [Acidobacteria bacterium]|nr:hypothetical protein [Acidobacteriota bacterium]MBI3655337.1 hypothetical protein [Acidobacteriota bacterium]